jgi:hypothetical protein
MRARGACASMRAWRGPGAAAHGFFHARWDRTDDGGLGELVRGSKTGRRPLLSSPPRPSRAFSQKVGGPSMHTPGHPRGGRRSGTKKPGGHLGGGKSWAAGPDGILLPDRAGTKHERGPDTGEGTADEGVLRRTPRREVPRTTLPRTRVNKKVRAYQLTFCATLRGAPQIDTFVLIKCTNTFVLTSAR